MTSPSPPVIDFSPDDLKSGTNRWLTTRTKVASALKEYGCFMAKYEKLSQCHEKLFSALKVIFDLPTETKKQNVSDIPDFAYKRNHPVLRPLYESFGIPEATTKEGTETFIKSMWPEGKNDMCRKILAYTITAKELAVMVMNMVFERYPVDHRFETGYMFRMMKDREVRLDFADHKDRMEFLAVLDLSQVNGLEMKTKDGKRIDVRPSGFLIMASKPLTEWSKGKIHHPEHPVTMDRNIKGYSVGLFSYLKEKNEAPKDIPKKKQ